MCGNLPHTDMAVSIPYPLQNEDFIVKPKRASRRGPKAEVLVIQGKWQDAVKKVLEVKTPEGGWPKQKHRKRRK